jgi:hypothetical protein
MKVSHSSSMCEFVLHLSYIQCLPIDKKDAIHTIFIIYIICRRLQSDCHCHCIGSPKARAVQARRHSFKDQYCLGISGVSSLFEYSSVCFMSTPQAGRIHTILQSTRLHGATAQSEAPSSSMRRSGANIAIFPFTSTVHDSYILDINEPRKVWICSYALCYAGLEVCVFVTSACLLTKRPFDFRHETTGEVEERGQENKMKLHVAGLIESCDEMTVTKWREIFL